jgi:hypothetical protein
MAIRLPDSDFVSEKVLGRQRIPLGTIDFFRYPKTTVSMPVDRLKLIALSLDETSEKETERFTLVTNSYHFLPDVYLRPLDRLHPAHSKQHQIDTRCMRWDWESPRKFESSVIQIQYT